MNELVQKSAPNIPKKSFLGAKEKKRDVAIKDVRNPVNINDNVEETPAAAAAEGSKEVTLAIKDSTENSCLLAETEGSHNATVAPKVVSRKQIAVLLGVVIILIVTLLAQPEQMAPLEAKVDELGEEIRTLTEEIGNDEEEITWERRIDQLMRIDNLVSKGKDTLNEFEELVNTQEEAYEKKHEVRMNVLQPAFSRLRSKIATWREVEIKHKEVLEKAVHMWKQYYPNQGEGGNAQLKLVLHHETSYGAKMKMEDTLEEMIRDNGIVGVKTSWEEAPKIRPDDVVRNFYKQTKSMRRLEN